MNRRMESRRVGVNSSTHDQMSVKRKAKGGKIYLGLWFGDTLHHAREGIVAGVEGLLMSGWIRKQKKGNSDVQLSFSFSHFIQFKTKMVLLHSGWTFFLDTFYG